MASPSNETVPLQKFGLPSMVCPVCILWLEAMSQEQNPKDMVNRLCKHTKCAQDLIPDWKEM